MSAVTHIGKTPLRRVYRGYLPLGNGTLDEVTLFVEADDYQKAKALILAYAATVLRNGGDELYNLKDSHEMMEWGESDDRALRIFESGWGPHGVTFVTDPVYLVRDPAAFAAKLAEATRHAA